MPVAVRGNTTAGEVIIIKAWVILNCFTQVNVGSETFVHKGTKSNGEVVRDTHDTGSWGERRERSIII